MVAPRSRVRPASVASRLKLTSYPSLAPTVSASDPSTSATSHVCGATLTSTPSKFTCLGRRQLFDVAASTSRAPAPLSKQCTTP